MKTIAIVVTERCQASSVFAMIDMLIAANYGACEFLGESSRPFEPMLIGLHAKETAYNGYTVTPLTHANQCQRADVVLIPGAFEAVLPETKVTDLLVRLKTFYPILKRWHEEGSIVGSVCTGNFLVAQAGLAAGRVLTCHWASEKTANQLFPKETFVSEKMLIDHGDLISAGGALAVSQLMLYLVQRFHSRELALATAKLMMVEPNMENQSRFAIFSPSKNHGDKLVESLQEQIEARFNESIDFSAYANARGITERHLNRRFKKLTGETPLSYQQRIRIERVKSALESTRKQMSKLVWEVGYEDLTSFRRLFKRYTGMTMQEYRSRFSVQGTVLNNSIEGIP